VSTPDRADLFQARGRKFAGLICFPVNARIQGMKVKVIIHEGEEGGFWAEVPALPGCFTEGESREELLANIKEAVEGCLLVSSGIAAPTEGGVEEEIEL